MSAHSKLLLVATLAVATLAPGCRSMSSGEATGDGIGTVLGAAVGRLLGIVVGDSLEEREAERTADTQLYEDLSGRTRPPRTEPPGPACDDPPPPWW